jgi:molybdopterin synthase sulfur carrier subunit
MKLRVLFFSVLRDITGAGEVVIELAAGQSTVSDLLDHLYQRWPRLRDWDRSLLIAVDQVYARRDEPLHHDAEVAIMPPVQGG